MNLSRVQQYLEGFLLPRGKCEGVLGCCCFATDNLTFMDLVHPYFFYAFMNLKVCFSDTYNSYNFQTLLYFC